MSSRATTYAFAAIVLAIVGMLIVPLPPALLDVLLALDVLGSALILLLSIRVEEPLDFSAFAPTLLLATLFRLALDVSATRLILTQGHEADGVGAVIPAFGAFVVRGNLVVGLIVFAILITIQFVVIATGAQRVAEVCARFTLDAMPGKQMAIDADVHAGALDADGARRKRARVQREADFYAAMDGAGKFVKGDAVAALVIVALNLLGGIVVGVAYHGLSPAQAVQTFALLSIGNALVTTLPALLISIAMGLLVTRVAGDGALGVDLARQLVERPDVLRSGGVLVCALAFVPALPGPVFFTLGASMFAVAMLADKRRRARSRDEERSRAGARRDALRRPETALGLVGVDVLTIEVGTDLLALLAAPTVDALLDRIGDVRRALATELGFVLPGVRLRDDLTRAPATYAIRVRDECVAEGSVQLGILLAIGDAPVLARIAGAPAREPVYGLEARAIDPAAREAAVAAGAVCFDAVSILGSHLAEVARLHAAALVGRQEFQTLLDALRARVPALVKDIGGELLPVATAHKAFVALLRERVWPRDAVATFEAMLDAAPAGREPRDLTDAARRVLVPAQLRRRGIATLRPLTLAPAFERRLLDTWSASGLAPEPEVALRLRDAVGAHASARADDATIVCSAAMRAPLAEFCRRAGLRVDVYAFSEIPPDVRFADVEIVDAGDVPGIGGSAR